MTGTHQIYARQRFYGNPRANSVYKHHAGKEVDKDPSLGIRLDKVLEEHLDSRTKEFVNSLKSWFDKKGGLTHNQLSSLERIESRFSPGEKAKAKEWEQEYRNQHASDAAILAQYYLRAGYWTQMAQDILNTEGYIPPKTKYLKMSNNKYALNVLRNFQDPPKFEKDTMVQLRATVGRTHEAAHLRPFKNRICFVIANTLSVLSATKGGKRYQVLPMGHSKPLVVEERDLMKPNKKGRTV